MSARATLPAAITDVAMRNNGVIFGKPGAGKSSVARVIFETELDRDHRSCFIDPMGDAAGIRMTPAGEPSRFQNVVIFGGASYDIPIGPDDGRKVAQVVGTTEKSFLIDLSDMAQSEQQHFMFAFADELYNCIATPLNLFCDEIHIFAPQDRSEAGAGTQLVNRMVRLVAQGRKRGIFMWGMTQRPARLSASFRAAGENLIAMKMTTPLDIKAVEGWLDAHGDPAKTREIVQSLSKLKPGEAFVWVPAADYLERYQFPMHSTFDSGRTPMHGEKVGRVALQKIDVSDIADMFGGMLTGDPRDDEIAALKLDILNERKRREDVLRHVKTLNERIQILTEREEHLTRLIVRIQNLIGLTVGSAEIRPVPFGHNPELYNAVAEQDGVIRAHLKAGDIKPAVKTAMRRARAEKE